MKAAYFLLYDYYWGRPLDDGVIRALLALDARVDVYMPHPPPVQTLYPEKRVRLYDVSYRLSWLQAQVWRRRWRDYDYFIGTADLPMAIAGLLSARTGAPAVTVCDEIFVGGYSGSATRYWRMVVKWGMRRAAFTIITDPCRQKLQRQYAGLSQTHRFVPYPCCFSQDMFTGSPAQWRIELGVPSDAVVLSLSGQMSAATGVHWMIDLLDRLPSNCYLLIQPGTTPEPLLHALLKRVAGTERLIYIPDRNPSFIDAMSLNLAADIGLVFYLSAKPQFQHMGVSSNKLCMYLQMGKPVIASRQPSFEFLENAGAGLLIDRETDVLQAVSTITADYTRYSRAARRCFETVIRPDEHLAQLRRAFEDCRNR